jgi:hypothetical protein
MQEIEAFTAGGVVSGAVARRGGLRYGLDRFPFLEVDGATSYALAGGTTQRRPHLRLEMDDVLILCPESAELPIHASWHLVELTLGPFLVSGALPTLPGFDPGRALARPGGPFIMLRDVRVDLIGHPEGGRVERPHALVNRYAVEGVGADIDLGYFFPGARFHALENAPSA